MLFDLGGVVYDIDFSMAFKAWEPMSELDAVGIAAEFSMDTQYERHETGQIDWVEYSTHLRQTLMLDGSDDEIAAGWNSIFLGEIHTVVEAVKSIRTQVRCCVLSNSNPVHKAFLVDKYHTTLSLFDGLFVSSDMGCRKPDPASFHHVADSTSCTPEEIVFFDDTWENVVMAKETGLDAVYVKTEQDVIEKLMVLGYV